MKTKLLLFLAFFSLNVASAQTTAAITDWTVSNVPLATRLAYPFEITYGPDGLLWITERKTDAGANEGERVIRVDPINGNKEELIDLSLKVYYAGGQAGLLGMAIHPALYTDITTITNNYVFVAYTYDSGAGVSKLRIARLVYNNSTGKLTADPSIDIVNGNGAIIEGLPASVDHNAGRLKIGPDSKLYYTVGDQGGNQSSLFCNEIRSQYIPSQVNVNNKIYNDYAGKILRLNFDGSIPSDNPTIESVKSHIYTYGHRNAQGLVFAADGTLYNSEQMDKVDDELNKIVVGKNYGWPQIAGYYDDNGYRYCNWSASANCSSQTFNVNSCATDVDDKTEFESGVPTDFQPPIGTIGSTTAIEPLSGYLTWPTKAPSSLDIYEAGLIPGWERSLFITSLKAATIYRAELNAAGDDIIGDTYEVFHTTAGGLTPTANNDRFRDTAFDPTAPGGFLMYAITDTNSGTNKGAIIKILYKGTTTLSTEDSLLSSFQLYPNPSATGSISVRMPNEIGDFNISISNMLGQQLFFEKRMNNKSVQAINTSNLNKGIYFVTVATNLGKSTKKVVIQ